LGAVVVELLGRRIEILQAGLICTDVVFIWSFVADTDWKIAGSQCFELVSLASILLALAEMITERSALDGGPVENELLGVPARIEHDPAYIRQFPSSRFQQLVCNWMVWRFTINCRSEKISKQRLHGLVVMCSVSHAKI
jgi:hypothetical protein